MKWLGFLTLILFLICPVISAEELKIEEEVFEPLVLKLMVVNPSEKHKQTYPIKAYLPEEVTPDHILEKDDLELGYDSEKKAYYAAKEVELEPGQSVVKQIKVMDVWIVPPEKLTELSDEAHGLFTRLKNTIYSEKARLLLNNIEVLLVQIYEKQKDKNLTPDEHISAYRDNKKKVYDIEMDLMAMRRFLAATGDQGLFGKANSGSRAALPSVMEKLMDPNRNGNIPAWLIWKVIFAVLLFIGAMSLLFSWVWQQQLKFTQKRRQAVLEADAIFKPESPGVKEKELKISDFYPGLSEPDDRRENRVA